MAHPVYIKSFYHKRNSLVTFVQTLPLDKIPQHTNLLGVHSQAVDSTCFKVLRARSTKSRKLYSNGPADPLIVFTAPVKCATWLLDKQ